MRRRRGGLQGSLLLRSQPGARMGVFARLEKSGRPPARAAADFSLPPPPPSAPRDVAGQPSGWRCGEGERYTGGRERNRWGEIRALVV